LGVHSELTAKPSINFETIKLLDYNFDRKIKVLIKISFICNKTMLKQTEQFHNFTVKCISGNKLTGSSPIICASWNSLLRMKFLPKVAVTLDITDVLSRSMVWYRGSGRSPVNLKMVIHNACAACNVRSWFRGLRLCFYFISGFMMTLNIVPRFPMYRVLF